MGTQTVWMVVIPLARLSRVPVTLLVMGASTTPAQTVIPVRPGIGSTWGNV